MKDAYSRNIDYVRISITDRCDLRCKYCMPNDIEPMAHEDILSYEEILSVCKALTAVGIKHFKVTGGEPFVRKGAVDFLEHLKKLDGVENVTVTTNGVELGKYIDKLAEIKIDGLNISLDTLDKQKYKAITGSERFDDVFAAFERAVALGLKVKINAVPMHDFNYDELADIASLAEKYPVSVRFIEMMPMGFGQGFTKVDGDKVLHLIKQKYDDIAPSSKKLGFGPAKYFESKYLKGSIGFINAISHEFCTDCNRVRLTSSGILKLCLYHNDGVDLKQLLRSGVSEKELVTSIKTAIMEKPEKHFFQSEEKVKDSRKMSQIGG